MNVHLMTRRTRLLVTVLHFDLVPESKRIEASVEAWGREAGCPVLNTRAAFAASDEYGRGGQEPLWSKHYTRRGHALVARTIREKLRELGWAP